MLSPDPTVLIQLKEYFASGYFEEPEALPIRRWSRAMRRHLEQRTLHRYEARLLYPSGLAQVGNENRILRPNYSFTWGYSQAALVERLTQAPDKHKATLSAMRAAMGDLESKLNVIKTPHTVGGRGYTHSIPNYGRVIREGLAEYEQRIVQRLSHAREQQDDERTDFYLGLLDVLEGIETWHRRLVEHLNATPTESAAAERRRKRLLQAYEHVPFEPARNFFEAILAYNFVYYLDDCDNLGRVDQELYDYYERDLIACRITPEEAHELVRNLWENCDINNGWSTGIGGTTSTGDPSFNDLTRICLQAAHKIRRPNLQLHVRQDMPQEVWDDALDAIASGCGIPALYNEEAYLRSLREAHLGIRETDLGWHNGGGCTETMVHGCSNVGSLDAGINLPLILVETLREHLGSTHGFDDLVTHVKARIVEVVREITEQVSEDQRRKAQLRPQPMRSLLIDDCIEMGREFNAGGARYNWSVINVAGLANLVDSLAAIREIVFEKREKTGAELLEVLEHDYEDEIVLLKRIAKCPRFGNADPIADQIAREMAEFVFREFLRYAPWRGGKFLPSCLMFVTYADVGRSVSATPDGRQAGDPIADSAGPHQGRDTQGPTAMLSSVASIPHHLAPGTLVVNMRLTRDFFTAPDGRRKIQDLVRTYFDLGGMQLQINVIDQQILKDAIAHPERHEDLIVRVGGYSEYFNRLSPELKRTVLERTAHSPS